MNHSIVVFALLLFSLLVFTGCDNKEMTDSYVLSSDKVVYGDRIYSIEIIEQNGSFLAYTEIGDDSETAHYACIDPLCSHEKDECIAVSNSSINDIALVPKSKGCMIYYFRVGRDSDGYGTEELMALDMNSGKCKKVCTLPSLAHPSQEYMITEEYAYFTMNVPDETNKQSINIYRAPITGGELEQITFAEDVMSGYRMEHYEDGVFYFRRGDTLCRTVDNFVTEETVMENLNLMWKIVFHGDWIYYTDKREVISVTPDEPMAENYTHVYDYMIGEYPDALDAANICTLMRVRNDGSGVMEELVSGVATCFNNTAANWCIVDNTLYCVPAKFELQGTYEWSDKLSPNSLSYIWSETGGELWAVDLETKEKHVVYADLGYDIQSITYTGKGKFLVCADIYEIDEIKAYYETHPITGSIDGYTEWKLIDIE